MICLAWITYPWYSQDLYGLDNTPLIFPEEDCTAVGMLGCDNPGRSILTVGSQRDTTSKHSWGPLLVPAHPTALVTLVVTGLPEHRRHL